MAGDWIKVEASTPNKPEVLRIARLLGITKDDAFGKSMRFWIWLDANCVDGRVDGVVSTDVDALVDKAGFANALESVGWLKCDDAKECLMVSNFDRHNGESAKKRALKNKRQANWRQNRDADVDAPPSTNASTREEKRREENKHTSAHRANEYTEEFETAWKRYPKRSGGNPKSKAFKAWRTRLREGHTPEEMLAGIDRYRAWLESSGKVGTEYVKQTASFLGPDKSFQESWVVMRAVGDDIFAGAK